MAIKTKIKLRTCSVCGVKKKVAEFSIGKICNKCEESTPTLREESTDDEVQLVVPAKVATTTDDLKSLHAKMDHLTQRFDRMEALVVGLMELVGKINYEMEMSKVEEDE
jgi:hypothetical protein